MFIPCSHNPRWKVLSGQAIVARGLASRHERQPMHARGTTLLLPGVHGRPSTAASTSSQRRHTCHLPGRDRGVGHRRHRCTRSGTCRRFSQARRQHRARARGRVRVRRSSDACTRRGQPCSRRDQVVWTLLSLALATRHQHGWPAHSRRTSVGHRVAPSAAHGEVSRSKVVSPPGQRVSSRSRAR